MSEPPEIAFGADMFEVFAEPPLGGWPGLALVLAIAFWLYRSALRD